MINKKLFSTIKKELEDFQKERNEIINKTRPIIQNAKKSIFALHQGDKKKSDEYLTLAEKALAELHQKYQKNQRLKFEGSYRAALEEYVEAKFFNLAISGKKLDLIKNVGAEEYVGGLADMTGELVRQAVLQATKGKFKELENYRLLMEEIVGFLLSMYLTGQQRQKFDEAKRNLKRLEQIIYETSLRS